MRAHTVSFVLASRRVLPRIYYTSTYICMRRSCLVLLLSSPAEGGGEGEEERSGIARVNYYCDVIAIILFFFSAHTTSSLGYEESRTRFCFCNWGWEDEKMNGGSGIKLDLVPLTSSWLIWYAPTKEYNSVLSNWVACLAVLCSTKDQRVVGGWRMDCQNTGVSVSVCWWY